MALSLEREEVGEAIESLTQLPPGVVREVHMTPEKVEVEVLVRDKNGMPLVFKQEGETPTVITGEVNYFIH